MWLAPRQWYRHEFHHLEKSLSPIRKTGRLLPYHCVPTTPQGIWWIQKNWGWGGFDKNTLYAHVKFSNNKKEVGSNWKKYLLGLILVVYLARTSGFWLPLLLPVWCKGISATTHFCCRDILIMYRRPTTDWSPSKAKSLSTSFFL